MIFKYLKNIKSIFNDEWKAYDLKYDKMFDKIHLTNRIIIWNKG